MASTPVALLLASIGFACGDQSHDEFTLTVTVAHDQNPELDAQAEEDKAILRFGVIGIEIDLGILVQEGGLGLLEGDSVLPKVRPVL
jgi:hypothetical protein